MNPSLTPDSFLLWESTCYDTVDFKKVYVDMAGDLAAGLLLSQIVYWHLPNRQGASKLRVQKGEHLWIAKRWDAWWAEVRLTEKQSIRAGEILVKLGIVVKDVFKFDGDRTVHLRINWETFLGLWKTTLGRSEEMRNAEPGKRTKRPEMPRRAKHPNGTQKSRLKAGGTISTKARKLQNALSSFCKTPFRRFAKRPFGTLQNALWGFSLTESTPKIFSKNLLEKKRGGVSDLGGTPQRGDQPSTPVAGPRKATHSSSKDSAAPKPSTPEAGSSRTAAGTALASGAVLRQVKAPQPDGAAVAAERDILMDLQDPIQPQAGVNEQATSTEKVPGGAAAAGPGSAEGSRGAGDGEGRPGVDYIRPVDAQVLSERPVMPLDGLAYKSLKALIGNNLPQLLKETTRTGGRSRALWLQLEEAEIDLVRSLAQTEVKTTPGLNMITLAVRGLDRLIGAVKVEKKASAKVSAAEVDPQLLSGQRCMVLEPDGSWALGMVEEIHEMQYRIQLDDRSVRKIDRTSVAKLRTLRASDAPAPSPTVAVEPVPFAPVGSTWRPKDGSPVVTVTAAEGMNRTLSTGIKLPMFKLTTGFEQVPA